MHTQTFDMTNTVRKITFCRACHNTHLEKVFSFGPTPLANAFLRSYQLDEPESYFPLDVYFCADCHLLQLGHVVSPELLFKDYVYVSSTSPAFVAHFRRYAERVIKRFTLTKNLLVVDIGSNDGILLKPFKVLGVSILGIEPAENIARRANAQGIPTLAKFFSSSVARQIVPRYGQAAVITANNVFAHIDDLDDVIKGVKILLYTNGVFIIEVPYLIDFLTKNFFDLVYHEHLSYFSVAALQTLFHRLGMEIFDVQKVSVHGGSVRIFVKKNDGRHAVRKSVVKFLKLEEKMKLEDVNTYRRFAQKILINKAKLLQLLVGLKTRGFSIAGYGAPAKGNTLLNYFSIGPDLLDFIADDSPFKQGLFTPGQHIPVVSSDTLRIKKPDYLLILAWNFAGQIIDKVRTYKESASKFIIPVPRPRVV